MTSSPTGAAPCSIAKDPMARAAAVLAIIFLAAATGCSPSILVRRDDTTFTRAEVRFARTLEAVSKANTSDEEKHLAIRAESLYQYRFQPPPRGFGSYLAQAAAVAIEIPAIQAIAGSLDIIDLRLRMSDGAVHLWETLLDRHPQTELRPLVLYRLGWAYRSTGATGLPRDSDEAFDLLAKDHPSSPLAPLAHEAKSWRWKSKGSATAWSVIPGFGQIYLGQYGGGLARFLIGVAAVAMMVTPTVIAIRRRHDLTWSRDWPLLAVGVGGLIVLSFDYTAAYQDAVRDVVRWNEAVETAFEDCHPEAP